MFTIDRVVIPRRRMLARRRYLANSKGELITTASGNVKQFYASELMRSHDSETNMTMDQALKLDKSERTPNNLNY